ncbi:Gfo/Idh/MocA family oxidoreductase [Streptomyces sp. ISL-22]|uniref:Gfo/Idh/MocA family protein n=1 Tax=unclassified Streptomyces TaxID=2593676 RepID=UPI001BE8AF88|nr:MULTISPECIES: Gfo/Idh/MocA family oxidoreductase [unclassified Streptomyces]MBT2419427.1 Gfo/Idh/MocA family oxidoreductase [Streptomyces sp. ISL-24]MBT2437778.1 Gfo/Idh/MocA family oxidoreductase [Streptomyces sp. ISL-22]
MSPTRHRRTAVVGTGHRAQTFTRALAERPGHLVAALCDPSPTRMAFHNRLLAEAGAPPATQWEPDRFADLLAKEDIDEVVVTTVDAEHDRYIVPALRAGCRVVTEKPMTVDAERCARILDTVRDTGNCLTVAFNYRFNPVHEKVRDLLADGAIGEVLSVHFEWLLDVRHGADYFRRWHRDKRHSGGLLVHKSSHHFDLVNWWLADEPRNVFGYGRLGFYGREAGERHGLRRDYDRAHGADQAATDPFALDLAADDTLRALYLDAERDDGYVRDRNVFDGPVTIEDDMAVLVRYGRGATMTYHLTAYSPWEGYRVMFNGSAGRLELDVEESRWQSPRTRIGSGSGALHGDTAAEHAGGARLTLRLLWRPPVDIPLVTAHEAHGGGDPRMLDALFGPVGPATPAGSPTTAHPTATERDGALALAVGLAANRCFETGRPVAVLELVPGVWG